MRDWITLAKSPLFQSGANGAAPLFRTICTRPRMGKKCSKLCNKVRFLTGVPRGISASGNTPALQAGVISPILISSTKLASTSGSSHLSLEQKSPVQIW